MATADVLSYVRSKDPRFANVPDDQIIQYAVSKDPKFAQILDTKDKAKLNLAATAKQEGLPATTAPKALAEGIQQRGVAAQQASDTKAYGQLGSDVAKTAIITGAGFATGGLALWPALAVMGGSGLASSLVGTGIEEATGTHETFGQRATEAGIDTALGVLGEFGGRAIGVIAKKALPDAIRATAAASQDGRNFLLSERTKAIEEIQSLVQKNAAKAKQAGQQVSMMNGRYLQLVDAEAPLKKAFTRVDRFIKASSGAKTPFETAYGSVPQAVSEAAETIKAQLANKGGQIGNMQDLSALISAKGQFQQFAHSGNLGDGAGIFMDAAEELDDIIRQNLKGVAGGKASALYQKTIDMAKATFKADQGTKLAETVVHRFIAGTIIGGGIGAAAGGAVGHAGLGATVGAMAGATMAPSLATFALKAVAENPRAAARFRAAVSLMNKPRFGTTGKYSLEVTPTALRLAKQAFDMGHVWPILGASLEPSPMAGQVSPVEAPQPGQQQP